MAAKRKYTFKKRTPKGEPVDTKMDPMQEQELGESLEADNEAVTPDDEEDEPVSPSHEEPPDYTIPVVTANPVPEAGPKCACGEPVAVGQNSVCIKHIRTN